MKICNVCGAGLSDLSSLGVYKCTGCLRTIPKKEYKPEEVKRELPALVKAQAF